jgi:hypothetical protein
VNCLVKQKQIKLSSSVFNENKAHARGFFFPRVLLEEQKAQAEAVFRLMIDSVVGLAILLIIISLINYFNGQIIEQSKNDLINLVKSSASSSNGVTIASSGDLTFARGFGIDGLDAQNWTQVNEKCFHFVSSASEGSIKIVDGVKAEFSQTLAIKVYSKCVPDQTCNPYDPENSCCMECTISFGKKLD